MKSARNGLIAVLAGAAFVLCLASTAQAVIQVQRGISGVRLGMSQARVKASLGTPAKVKHGSNPFGSFTVFRYAGGIRVTFQGNKNVTAVSITGHTDQTPSGVGVGSTEQQVKNGIHGVKCDSGNHSGGTRSCHVGSFKPGHRVTDFLIRNGHVTRVTVGFVID